MLYEKGSSKAMLTNLACVSAAVSKACFWTQFREKYFGCLKPFGGHLKKVLNQWGKGPYSGYKLSESTCSGVREILLTQWAPNSKTGGCQLFQNTSSGSGKGCTHLKGSRPGESYYRGRPDFWLDRFLPENC